MIDECASLICQTSTEIALKLLERTFELRGPEGLGAKPRPELIGPLFTHLHDTLQDAVRMGFLHSSRARGRIPGSLRAAAEVRYLGHSAGGDEATLLHFEVPSFGSVAAELFEQQLLWDDGPKPEETAFELFGAAVNDVRQRRTESNRFDPPLLRRISSYRRIAGARLGTNRHAGHCVVRARGNRRGNGECGNRTQRRDSARAPSARGGPA